MFDLAINQNAIFETDYLENIQKKISNIEIDDLIQLSRLQYTGSNFTSIEKIDFPAVKRQEQKVRATYKTKIKEMAQFQKNNENSQSVIQELNKKFSEIDTTMASELLHVASEFEGLGNVLFEQKSKTDRSIKNAKLKTDSNATKAQKKILDILQSMAELNDREKYELAAKWSSAYQKGMKKSQKDASRTMYAKDLENLNALLEVSRTAATLKG